MEAASLTPAQESTLALLRRDGDPVVFDRHLIDSLTADFAEAFEHLSSRVEATGGDLFINKTRLTSVLGCEEHHLNGAPFEWNTRNAVGTVSHRSVDLITNWRGEITPADVVDELKTSLSRRAVSWPASLLFIVFGARSGASGCECSPHQA